MKNNLFIKFINKHKLCFILIFIFFIFYFYYVDIIICYIHFYDFLIHYYNVFLSWLFKFCSCEPKSHKITNWFMKIKNYRTQNNIEKNFLKNIGLSANKLKEIDQNYIWDKSDLGLFKNWPGNECEIPNAANPYSWTQNYNIQKHKEFIEYLRKNIKNIK